MNRKNEKYKYKGLTVEFKSKALCDKFRGAFIVELARELKSPTCRKNWAICSRAALCRAAEKVGGKVLE